MDKLKAIHKYLCKPMDINTYEYIGMLMLALIMQDLIN